MSPPRSKRGRSRSSIVGIPKSANSGTIELRKFDHRQVEDEQSANSTVDWYQLVLVFVKKSGKQYVARVSKVFELDPSGSPLSDALLRLEDIRRYAKQSGLIEIEKEESAPWFAYQY